MTQKLSLIVLGVAGLTACAGHLDAQRNAHHDAHAHPHKGRVVMLDDVTHGEWHSHHDLHEMHGHADHDWKAMLKEAGLGDGQIKQIVDLHHAALLERIDLEAEIEKAELRLAIAMHDDDATLETVDASLDALFAAKAALGKSFTRELFAAKKVAGAESWAKLQPHVHEHLMEVADLLGIGGDEDGGEEWEEEVHRMHGRHGHGHGQGQGDAEEVHDVIIERIRDARRRHEHAKPERDARDR